MKKYSLLLMAVILCVFSGCLFFGKKTTLDTFFTEQKPSAFETLIGDLKINAGFVLLEDMRPQKDISYMSSVRENVSAQVLEAIKGTNIFTTINYPSNKDEQFIISGEIRRFSWESFDTMISYIPVMNVFNLFGLPSTRTQAEVEIYLRVKDTASNKVVFEIAEQCIKKAKYNIYNFKTSKANEELSFCFQDVLSKIGKRFLSEKMAIAQAVRSSVPIVAQAAEAKEEAKVIEEKMKVAEEKMKEAEKKMKEVEKKAVAVEKMAEKVEEKVKKAEEKVKAAEEKIEEEFQ